MKYAEFLVYIVSKLFESKMYTNEINCMMSEAWNVMFIFIIIKLTTS